MAWELCALLDSASPDKQKHIGAETHVYWGQKWRELKNRTESCDCSSLSHSLEREAGAWESPTPLAEELEHILACRAVRCLQNKRDVLGIGNVAVQSPSAHGYPRELTELHRNAPAPFQPSSTQRRWCTKMALVWCSSTQLGQCFIISMNDSIEHAAACLPAPRNAWLTLTAIRNLFHVSLLASRPGRLNSILFLSTGYPGHTVTTSQTR